MARRKRSDEPRDFRSVAPARWARRLVGVKANDLNAAIEVFATAITVASRANEKAFNKAQWEKLARLLWQTEFPTDCQNIHQQVSDLVQQEFPKDKDLYTLVVKLDFWGAWALVYACRAFDPAVSQWWKVDRRLKDEADVEKKKED